MKNYIPAPFWMLAVLALFLFNFQTLMVSAQGTTAFTYQGQLHDNGTNANGNYTLIFNLYDSPSSGNLIGGPITTSATLVNGLFTANLDFGASAFNGSARYLGITITNNGDTETLSPRVQVLPSPYALYAVIASTVTNGAIMNAQLAPNAIATTNIQNGAITSALMANGAIMNAQLAANAVKDANIVSVSGSKVIGSVASATDADLLGGLDASSFALADDLTNFVSLDADQTFTGTNTFDKDVAINGDIVAGDWDIGISEYKGYSDLLTFSQGGNYRVAIAPTGIGSGEGGDVGLVIFDGLSVDGAMAVNGGHLEMNGYDIVDVNDIEVNYINGGLAGSASVTPATTVASALSSQDILNRVAGLNISTWQAGNKASVKSHPGPNPNDFNALFGFEHKTNVISLVDETGVALAAIQGLNQKLEVEAKTKDVKIEELEKQLAELKVQVKALANSPGKGTK